MTEVERKGRLKYFELMFSLNNSYHETIAQGQTINIKLLSVLLNDVEIYFNVRRNTEFN